MELLIGCGHSRIKRVVPAGYSSRWTNLTTLDCKAHTNPDVNWNLNKIPYPFNDNQFDEIHAYDVLEHCGQQGDWEFFFRQFDEFARILKHEGIICITAPNHDSKWLWGDPSHTRYMGPQVYSFLDRDSYFKGDESARTDFSPYFTSHWKCMVYDVSQDKTSIIVLMNLKRIEEGLVG